MKKFKNKMLKIISFFIMFLTCINIVNAKSDFKETTTKNLYEKCNEENKCIPICIYNTVSADEEEKDYNDGEKAYVGYYYDYQDTKTTSWEIGEIRIYTTRSDIWGTKHHNTLYTIFDTRLPKTDIYWGGYGKDGDKTWDKAVVNGQEPYKNLYENFECPEYINVDKSGIDIELCFSNDKGKCEAQESGGTNFKEKQDRSVKYKFTDELEKVINDTYNKLYIFDSQYPAGADPDADKKVKFFADVDADFNQKYNPNKSARENALEYCSILEEKLKEDEKYFNSLGKEQEYKNIINKQLQESATNFNVKNKQIYTDEMLSSILTIKDASGNKTYRQVLDATDQTYIEKLHNIYGQNIRTSLNYVKDMCNTLPDTNIEYDEQKLVDTVRDKYETQFYDISIDKITEFNCGTLGDLADLVKTGYFIIEMVALVILVVFTVLDYAKVILSGEQDEMKKTNKRLATRLIIMVVLLLLPALINFVLGVFNIEGFNSENPLCVEIKNK